MLSRALPRASAPLCNQTRSCSRPLALASPRALSTHTRPASQPFRTSIISSRIPAPLRARIQSRWYASSGEAAEQAEATKEAKSEDDSAAPKGAKDEADPVKKEIEAKNKEIIDLKDKYLRSVADFRNLQERSRREQQAAKDFAIQRFARDLIESVDNLDLALSNVAADKLKAPASDASSDPYKELRELHSGLEMTSTVLLNTLKKHGLQRFDPAETSEKFDPNLHEATFQAPQPDKEDGTVFHTTQKGFMLNDRILRAAKVGVVKNS